jgi:hypothetical protein
LRRGEAHKVRRESVWEKGLKARVMYTLVTIWKRKRQDMIWMYDASFLEKKK